VWCVLTGQPQSKNRAFVFGPSHHRFTQLLIASVLTLLLRSALSGRNGNSALALTLGLFTSTNASLRDYRLVLPLTRRSTGKCTHHWTFLGSASNALLMAQFTYNYCIPSVWCRFGAVRCSLVLMLAMCQVMDRRIVNASCLHSRILTNSDAYTLQK
jgi:hypothetical protein